MAYQLRTSFCDRQNRLAEFAKFLHDNGVELLSTGGTAKTISDAGIPVVEVSNSFSPEISVAGISSQIHGGIWRGATTMMINRNGGK